MDNESMKKVAAQFCIEDGAVLTEWVRFGSGHINETYRVVFDVEGKEEAYIFQKVNTNVFKQPEQLMSNMIRVLDLYEKALTGESDELRRYLHLVPTRDGKKYLLNENGCWRVTRFIAGSITYDILETPEQAYQAARAFGAFQCHVSGMKGERLYETIPNFHNTPSRYADFQAALQADKCGRAKLCRKEIEFAESFSRHAPRLIDLLNKGELPERITHNDTKLNNVLLDKKTGKSLCVIDLDTVMPGLSLYDFGDMVRTSVSPAAEDETDLSKVQVRTEVFRALVKGYLEGSNNCLTAKEIELLPFSGMLITYEIGLRFLTDYLEGDVYFQIHRENHNLDRCRTQFTLVQRLLEKEAELDAIVAEFLK